jgi:hypothetical protein
MTEIARYRPEDRRVVEALYRRVFGTDAADASRLRWEWQYARNPNNPPDGPQIWIAREGTSDRREAGLVRLLGRCLTAGRLLAFDRLGPPRACRGVSAETDGHCEDNDRRVHTAHYLSPMVTNASTTSPWC